MWIKKITEEQLNEIIGIVYKRKKPILYQVTSTSGDVYRSFNVSIFIGTNQAGKNYYAISMNTVFSQSSAIGEGNVEVYSSPVLVNFMPNTDGTYNMSVGEI